MRYGAPLSRISPEAPHAVYECWLRSAGAGTLAVNLLLPWRCEEDAGVFADAAAADEGKIELVGVLTDHTTVH